MLLLISATADMGYSNYENALVAPHPKNQLTYIGLLVRPVFYRLMPPRSPLKIGALSAVLRELAEHVNHLLGTAESSFLRITNPNFLFSCEDFSNRG